MSIKITSKDLEVTQSIEKYVGEKIERISKYFEEEPVVTVTIKFEKTEKVAEIRATINSNIYKAVTAHKDLYAAIDKDIDILEGQIRKNKTKKEKMIKDGGSIKEIITENVLKNTEIENEIIKELYYDIKPMTPEDAKLKLQEKTNDLFLPFINIETGKVNVLYKLNDNKNYGLVHPEA